MFGEIGEEEDLIFVRQAFSSSLNEVGGFDVGKPRNITATGSLQPYSTDTSKAREGNMRKMEHRGYSSSDAFVFFCDTKLRTDDQFDATKADYTLIDGRKYYVWAIKNWSHFGTDLDHYEVVLSRKEVEEEAV